MSRNNKDLAHSITVLFEEKADDMISVIERLQREKGEEQKEYQAEGKTAGMEWAKSARHRELKRVMVSKDDNDLHILSPNRFCLHDWGKEGMNQICRVIVFCVCPFIALY